jgi:DNA-binding response OmpR family regulator
MSARILLIEDDPLWVDAIVTILGKEGYKVEVASNVDEARELLGLAGSQPPERKFDLLIVDIRLPRDNEGLQILAEVRKQQEEASIHWEEQPRVIMSTVLHHVSVEKEWKERVRWDAYLVKRYELYELVDSMRKLLSSTQ